MTSRNISRTCPREKSRKTWPVSSTEAGSIDCERPTSFLTIFPSADADEHRKVAKRKSCPPGEHLSTSSYNDGDAPFSQQDDHPTSGATEIFKRAPKWARPGYARTILDGRILAEKALRLTVFVADGIGTGNSLDKTARVMRRPR